MSERVCLEIMPPVRQKSWGLAAVVNFWLGGMASGAYIFASVMQTGRVEEMSKYFQLLLFFLTGTGFFLLALHIGRPSSVQYAARHLRSSWMARETAAGLLFFAAAGWYFFFTNAIANLLAAFAAFLFLISQSFILYRGKGVSGWDTAMVPVHFTLSSLSSGIGLILLVAPFPAADIFQILEVTAIILVVANAAAWFFYINHISASCPHAFPILRNLKALTLVMGGGMLVPLLLLLIMVTQPSAGNTADGWVRFFQITAGLCLVWGALSQKYLVIMKAGWVKKLTLE